MQAQQITIGEKDNCFIYENTFNSKEILKHEDFRIYIIDIVPEQIGSFECVIETQNSAFWAAYTANGISFHPSVLIENLNVLPIDKIQDTLEKYHHELYPECFLPKKFLFVRKVKIFDDFSINFIEDDVFIKNNPEFEFVVETDNYLCWGECTYSRFNQIGNLNELPFYDKILDYIYNKHLKNDQKYHLNRLRKKLPVCYPSWEKDQQNHPDPEIRSLSSELYKKYLSGDYVPEQSQCEENFNE